MQNWFKTLTILCLTVGLNCTYGNNNLSISNFAANNNNSISALCGVGTSRFNCYFRQLTYNAKLAQFVAVGTRNPDAQHPGVDQEIGFIAISSDGVNNWQAVTLPNDIGRLNNIEKSTNGSTYIAVGEKHTILKSSDGSHWKRISLQGQNLDPLTNFLSLTWNSAEHKFLIIGIDPQDQGVVASSVDDGETWQINSLLVGANHNNFNGGLMRVIWDEVKHQYLGVGLEDDAQFSNIEVILTSSDGIYWQKHYTNQAKSLGMLYDITKYKNTYLAVGAYGDATLAHADIQTSSDGINWQQQISGIENLPAKLSAIATKADKIVVMGKDYAYNPGKIISLVSSDGLSWSRYDTGYTQNAICLVGINWDLSNMVVVGLTDLPDSQGYSQFTAQVLNSPNGINWTSPF